MRRLMGSLGPFGPLVPIVGILALTWVVAWSWSSYHAIREMQNEIHYADTHTKTLANPFTRSTPSASDETMKRYGGVHEEDPADAQRSENHDSTLDTE